jgi:3-deoxy-D-manno-octulosonic-acid transferase
MLALSDPSCSNTPMEDSGFHPAKWQQHLTLALPEARPGCIWVHACSVGEVGSVVPLIRAISGMGHDIHLTVVTATGFAHADRKLGNDITISYLPWDIPGAMSRFIRQLRPALLLLTETEFWPGKLSACRKYQVPVISINTRISDRSFPRYFASRFLWRRWLAPVSLFLAQSQQDAERLIAIGVAAEKVQTAGNLKYAVSAPRLDAETLRQKLDASGRRPILLVASTHEGEDALILDMWESWHAHNRDMLTVFVPRHPQRFDSVATLIQERGHSLSRWSESEQHNADFILIDAMGVLDKLYCIADIVIVAGSLVDIGGHNPLEAAICGRGVVTGPYVQNFREIMDEMKQSNSAIVANDEQELEAAVNRLLTMPDELKTLHASATLFINDKAQVLNHILSAIDPYLENTQQDHHD